MTQRHNRVVQTDSVGFEDWSWIHFKLKINSCSKQIRNTFGILLPMAMVRFSTYGWKSSSAVPKNPVCLHEIPQDFSLLNKYYRKHLRLKTGSAGQDYLSHERSKFSFTALEIAVRLGKRKCIWKLGENTADIV